MLSSDLINQIELELTDLENDEVQVIGTKNCSGGSINYAYELKTSHGSYFIKVNSADRFPGMFESEAKGMGLLKAKCTLEIPKVHFTGTCSGLSYIVMEFLESGRLRPEYWEDFGARLARLHRTTSDAFGLDHDNYIGSLAQDNQPTGDWPTFFIAHRLEPLVEMAVNQGQMDKSTAMRFAACYREIAGVFPIEPASLIHGDLWSGNFMAGPTGIASIFDPAVYFGHREMDMAMTKLFGGFQPDFYRGYNETFPLESGWEKRADVANLYPLMVHVVLFGGGYLGQVQQILKRFN